MYLFLIFNIKLKYHESQFIKNVNRFVTTCASTHRRDADPSSLMQQYSTQWAMTDISVNFQHNIVLLYLLTCS